MVTKLYRLFIILFIGYSLAKIQMVTKPQIHYNISNSILNQVVYWFLLKDCTS